MESVIDNLIPLMSEGDMIIDGGNEWYENTVARSKKVAEHGLHYMGMGVSGGEDGARFGYIYVIITCFVLKLLNNFTGLSQALKEKKNVSKHL